MATNPILIVGDGVIEIPEELRTDPNFRKGSALRLVPVQQAHIAEKNDAAERDGAKADWRKLDGILAGIPFDATAWKRREREWELAHDERKFGTKRPSW